MVLLKGKSMGEFNHNDVNYEKKHKTEGFCQLWSNDTIMTKPNKRYTHEVVTSFIAMVSQYEETAATKVP